jgi:CRISPR-associated protein Csd1
LWNEIEKNLNKKFSTFSFLIEGESTIVASKTELINTDDDKDSEGGQMCLVSGKKGNLVETTTATMIPGSQATAKLVSFQVSSGYDSYGKNKGYNAPISEDAEFAYTTALNHLLRSDSQNKFLLGSRTFVFWASKDDEAGKQAEESIWDMLGFKDNDDPDKNIINVRKAFESIYSGSIKTTLDDRFYILGLAPNSARIAVTYWADIPLKVFSEMILRHFKDMEIVDTRKEKKPYFGLHSLLATVSLEGKSSNVSPNLPDAVVKSIFQGLPYPQTLFASCIRRIRAEQNISITRAAILKSYLNRLNDNNNNKLTVMLDTSNTNQGYLCGRLFAVLDKIQDDANNQRSIKERYINSASATPAAVFSTILNLSLHHSAKLNEGRSVYYEKIKQEIVDKISADGFPAHLDLQDQGRFFVGYYHQMQWFYTKNSDKEVDNND